MKILSKFQDYYDFTCGFFSNETTYDRKIIIERDDGVIEKMKKYGNLNRRYDMSSDIETEISTGVIFLANKPYPFLKMKQTKRRSTNDRSAVILDKFFYQLEGELQDIIEKDSSNIWVSIKSYERFFNQKKELECSHPIAIYYPGLSLNSEVTSLDTKELYNVKAAYNVKLKDYKFPVDGRIVLQEIETFLNRSKEGLSTVIKDDKVLLHSKGFDEASFKKEKRPK